MNTLASVLILAWLFEWLLRLDNRFFRIFSGLKPSSRAVAMSFRMSPPVRVFAISVAVLLLSITFELPQRLSDLCSAQQVVPGNGLNASVLIIGGSHAGLSAALTLARHQIDSLILDGDNPRNKWKTPTHTLPTWEDRSPDEVRRDSRRELRKSGFARFVHTQVTTIRRPEADQSFFEVEDLQGRIWRGRKLLLATGVDFVFPDIEGYEENFPDRMYKTQTFPLLFSPPLPHCFFGFNSVELILCLGFLLT